MTGRDGRVSQLDQVYIRGSMVRFFIVPDMLQNAPMWVATYNLFATYVLTPLVQVQTSGTQRDERQRYWYSTWTGYDHAGCVLLHFFFDSHFLTCDPILANGMYNDTFCSTSLTFIVSPILQHGVAAEFQRRQDEASGDEKIGTVKWCLHVVVLFLV